MTSPADPNLNAPGVPATPAPPSSSDANGHVELQTVPGNPLLDQLDNLSDFEKRLLGTFVDRGQTEGEGAAGEGEAQTPSTDPSSHAGGEGAASVPASPEVAAGAEGEPGASATQQTPQPTPETSPAETPPPTGPTTYEVKYTYTDEQSGRLVEEERIITQHDLDNALSIQRWAQRLQPQEIDAIDGVLTGRYTLVSAEDLPAIQQYYQQMQQGQQPQPTFPQPSPPGSSPTAPTAPAGPGGVPAPPPGQQFQPQFDPNQFEDPQLAAYIAQQNAAMQQQMAQLQAQMQQQTQASQLSVEQQRIESARSQIDEGEQAFASDYQLNADELNQLRQQVVSGNQFASFVAANNGDYKAAVKQALENTYWTDPRFRSREMQRHAQQQVNDQLAATAQQNARASKQAALAGAGGSVVRTDQPTPRTKEEREAAMVAEISRMAESGELYVQ